ncbi:MAG: site-specific integrase [Carboxylicivirga sp.]|jgi:site-specific recombinase XerC|nr:site-specific integrase [Carboxylicivirga sp.]
MASVNAVIDKRFTKSKGGYPILIRILHPRKEDIGIGEYLPKLEYFDKAKERVKKRKGIEHERINELIIEKLQHYRERVKITPKVNTNTNVSLTSSESILEEFECILEDLNSDGKYNSHRIYNYTYRYLTEFLNSKNKTTLSVYEIDVGFLRRWKAFMKGKGLTGSTIQTYVEKLRASHNNLVERLSISKSNPFKKFTVVKEKKKTTIGGGFIVKLISYIPKSKERIKYKNMFVAQYFLHGTRISDLLLFRYTDLKIEGLERDVIVDEFSTLSETITALKQLPVKQNYADVRFRIEFNAFKTGHEHKIALSNKAILQMRFFLDEDLQLRFLEKNKDDELSIFLGIENKNRYELEELNKILFSTRTNSNVHDDSSVTLMKELIVIQYKRNKNKPIFHNWSFDDLDGNDLKKFIQSKTTYVNKSLYSNLKEPFYAARLKERISSHYARHLFSIRYYEHTKDLYRLSKLLGHTKVTTTQIYLEKLNVSVDDTANAIDFYDEI